MSPLVVLHLAYGALRSMASGALLSGVGRATFVETFAPEGLVPLGPAAREIWPSTGRCLACGACERPGASPREALERTRGLDRLAEAAHLLRPLEGLGQEALEELERTCPASIPFGLIVRELGPMLDRDAPLG